MRRALDINNRAYYHKLYLDLAEFSFDFSLDELHAYLAAFPRRSKGEKSRPNSSS